MRCIRPEVRTHRQPRHGVPTIARTVSHHPRTMSTPLRNALLPRVPQVQRNPVPFQVQQRCARNQIQHNQHLHSASGRHRLGGQLLRGHRGLWSAVPGSVVYGRRTPADTQSEFLVRQHLSAVQCDCDRNVSDRLEEREQVSGGYYFLHKCLLFDQLLGVAGAVYAGQSGGYCVPEGRYSAALGAERWWESVVYCRFCVDLLHIGGCDGVVRDSNVFVAFASHWWVSVDIDW